MKALEGAQFVDIRQDGVPAPLLDRALALHGEALVNRRSTTWRGLDEAERARPPLELLRDYPALMKRPLIEDGADVYLGWTAEVQRALGL